MIIIAVVVIFIIIKRYIVYRTGHMAFLIPHDDYIAMTAIVTW